MTTPFPIAIVTSRFNEEITKRLHDGAIERLLQSGFNHDHINSIWVPGAVEIPLVLQRLAQSKRYQALIALGAVIRGETGHYDYVCKQVSDGCQKISLQYDIPVIFGVLTTDNGEQALARSGGAHSHKGYESVDAAIEMVEILNQLA